MKKLKKLFKDRQKRLDDMARPYRIQNLFAFDPLHKLWVDMEVLKAQVDNDETDRELLQHFNI